MGSRGKCQILSQSACCSEKNETPNLNQKSPSISDISPIFYRKIGLLLRRHKVYFGVLTSAPQSRVRVWYDEDRPGSGELACHLPDRGSRPQTQGILRWSAILKNAILSLEVSFGVNVGAMN